MNETSATRSIRLSRERKAERLAAEGINLNQDPLDRLIASALAATVEAEKLAYAGGMRRTVGAELIEAHSALLRARTAR